MSVRPLSFPSPAPTSPLLVLAGGLEEIARGLKQLVERAAVVPAGVEYFSVPEVSSRLGISQSQVRSLIRGKKIVARRFGRRNYRVASNDLELYVRRSR